MGRTVSRVEVWRRLAGRHRPTDRSSSTAAEGWTSPRLPRKARSMPAVRCGRTPCWFTTSGSRRSDGMRSLLEASACVVPALNDFLLARTLYAAVVVARHPDVCAWRPTRA